MKLFDKLLHESAVLLRNLAKRLDEDQDESAVLAPSIPYWHQHVYGTRAESMPPLEPWEREQVRERLGHKSPLLFPENRRAIERVFAKRGFRADDTIDQVLKESRR